VRICANCTFGRSCSHKNTSKSRGKKSNARRRESLLIAKTWGYSVCLLQNSHAHTKGLLFDENCSFAAERFIFSMTHRTLRGWYGDGRVRTKRLSFSRSVSEFYADYFHQLQRRGFIFSALERGVECSVKMGKLNKNIVSALAYLPKSKDFA
jgi:hypothetical protein